MSITWSNIDIRKASQYKSAIIERTSYIVNRLSIYYEKQKYDQSMVSKYTVDFWNDCCITRFDIFLSDDLGFSSRGAVPRQIILTPIKEVLKEACLLTMRMFLVKKTLCAVKQ
jgi:hypothetical protein